jgi:hypothetical protein
MSCRGQARIDEGTNHKPRRMAHSCVAHLASIREPYKRWGTELGTRQNILFFRPPLSLQHSIDTMVANWEPGTSYGHGDVVRYEGRLRYCVQSECH